jgi:hypothetical protein
MTTERLSKMDAILEKEGWNFRMRKVTDNARIQLERAQFMTDRSAAADMLAKNHDKFVTLLRLGIWNFSVKEKEELLAFFANGYTIYDLVKLV